MWDSTVGINTRWVIKMSTQDQLITPVYSEVNMKATQILFLVMLCCVYQKATTTKQHPCCLDDTASSFWK